VHTVIVLSYDSLVSKEAKLFHCNAMPDRWIGTDEAGELVHWPREEGGWAHRTVFHMGRKILVEVEPALARGTGWFGAGAGRPPRGAGGIVGGSASSPVTIRATDEERQTWEAAAKKTGQKLSEWAREKLNKAASK